MYICLHNLTFCKVLRISSRNSNVRRKVKIYLPQVVEVSVFGEKQPTKIKSLTPKEEKDMNLMIKERGHLLIPNN
jgi:hypothetical protein